MLLGLVLIRSNTFQFDQAFLGNNLNGDVFTMESMMAEPYFPKSALTDSA